ncbi:MAG: hypothetical protein HZC28_03655 [Spirochaetes bacterium]|nr:hypothetical protein [Spirochaetota bacterium]
MRQYATIVIAAIMSALNVFGGITLPKVISDSVVLQRNRPITIWGASSAGAAISVAIVDDATGVIVRSGKTAAGADGRWKLKLEAMEASFKKHRITVSGDGSDITVKDVLVGEVWFTSGQSNMQLELQYIIGGKEMLARATNANIRIFYQSSVDKQWYTNVSFEPCDDVSRGYWAPANAGSNVAYCSGIAYTFALALFNALNRNAEIPVAVMNSAVGATGVMAWMSRAKAQSLPELAAKLPAKWNEGTWGQWYKPWNQATALFNHKVAPFTDFAVRGFLWTQGENDAGFGEAGAAFYRTALAALIDDWRTQWNDTAAPFIFSQLHAYDNNGTMTEDKFENWAYMREAQLEISARVSNTAAVAIHDVDLVWDQGAFGSKSPVHPLTKKPVGERMALAARAIAYGEQIEYCGPVFDRMKIDGGRILLKFTHRGNGLMNRDGGTAVTGFAICGSDRVFLPAAAIINGAVVEVSNPGITAPVAVTYGFTSMNNCANLFSTDGLPAVPFRTDRVKSQFMKGCAAGKKPDAADMNKNVVTTFVASGVWQNSAAVTYEGKPTVMTKKKGSSAKGVLSVASGSYKISYFMAVSGAPYDDNAVRIDVKHNGKTDTTTLDCSRAPGGWTDVGVFDFAGTGEECVIITRTSPDSETVATRAIAVRAAAQ